MAAESSSTSGKTCNDGLEEAGDRRKTWSELRGVVSDLRRRLAGVSAGSVPSAVTFRSLPDGRLVLDLLLRDCSKKLILIFVSLLHFRTRIYFLSTPSNGWETTLLYVDIAHSDHSNGYRLHWQSVIEANFQR